MPIPPPKKLPLDMTKVETSKGCWGLFIETVIDTQAGRNLLVRVILEQMIDNERFRMRNLEIIVNTRDAYDPDSAPQIANRIRQWIESTEGDGFIDLERSD